MDVNLRIRADTLGLPQRGLREPIRRLDQLDPGVVELTVTGEELDRFFETGHLAPPDQHRSTPTYPSCCVTPARVRAPGSGATTRPRPRSAALRVPREGVMGISPRNQEQSFALDLMLDDSDSAGHGDRQGRAPERRSWHWLPASCAPWTTAPTRGCW